ncbi:MAG: transposase [Phycisphaerales bacterium]|nr:transposase [Phycisphaerales bacterium]
MGHHKRLRRWENPEQPRFLTFSCEGRLPLFSNHRIKDRFVEHLRDARERFGFNLYAWVVMPEHIHLLLWPRLPEFPVGITLRELKRDFASEVIRRWRGMNARILDRLVAPDGSTRFWLRGGGYDDNVESIDEVANVIEYIHQNPVRRGLASRAEEWAWSSAAWYAGNREGVVPIDPLPARKPVRTRGSTPRVG